MKSEYYIDRKTTSIYFPDDEMGNKQNIGNIRERVAKYEEAAQNIKLKYIGAQ